MNARTHNPTPKDARPVLLTLPLDRLASLMHHCTREPDGGPAAAAIADLIRAAVVARAAVRKLLDTPTKEAAA